MRVPRVGIIGARRARQGLGPFVARWLTAAGAQVPCFLATSEASLAAAAEQWKAGAGLRARGYLDADAMLSEQALDAVAILTPSPSHRAWLEWALAAGLDVLCDKPLVWGAPNDLAAGHALVADFAARGLLLMENCQWPETLPAFFALHPALRGAPLRRFAMRLAPASTGSAAIGDALSHPLSLLQALRPAARAWIEEPRFSTRDADASQLALAFRWHTAGAATVAGASAAGGASAAPLPAVADESPVEVMVELSTSPGQPREASLAVNGFWAHRLIRTSDYALFFASGARLVDLPDPLQLRVQRFVAALRADRPRVSVDENLRILQRLQALDLLGRSFSGQTP